MTLDRIINMMMRDKVGMTSIEDKMRDVRLRWFGYVRSAYILARRCDRLTLL